MKIRTSQPKSNKYYIRQVSGGLNGAVAGKPTIKGANVLCNCVGYANGRFNEIIGDPELKGTVKAFKYQLVCNAENFIESAKKQGLKISSRPVKGGIMVWQKGRTLSGGDGAGHVEVVEEVYTDGTVLCSSSGWNGWAFRTLRRNNSNGRWGQASGYKYRGCIINPYVDGKPAKLVEDGVGGTATVYRLQEFFNTPQDGVIGGQKKDHAKYRKSLIAVKNGSGGSQCVRKLQAWVGVKQDGDWGHATTIALQKKLGLKQDGDFGKHSMKTLQHYLNTHDKPDAPTPPTPPTPKGYTGEYPNTTVKTDKGKDLIAKADAYCWPYGTASSKYSYKKGSAKPAYKSALKKYMGKSKKVSQSDCGYFVSTCVRACGLGSKFLALPASKKDKYPAVPSTMEIVHKGKAIPSGLLKAGDIIRYRKSGGQHTMMFYANGKIAEAQRSNNFPAIKKDTKKYNASNVVKSSIQVLRAKGTTARLYLMKGDTGEEVKKLQKYLNWYDPKNNLTVDGVYGNATETAVKKFQTEQKITVDGKAGTGTLEKMKAVKK